MPATFDDKAFTHYFSRLQVGKILVGEILEVPGCVFAHFILDFPTNAFHFQQDSFPQLKPLVTSKEKVKQTLAVTKPLIAMAIQLNGGESFVVFLPGLTDFYNSSYYVF